MPTPSRTNRQTAGAVARPAGRPLPGRTAPLPEQKPTDLDPGTFRAIVAGLLALVVVATGFGVHRFLQAPEDAPQAGCAIGLDAQGSNSVNRENVEKWLPEQISGCADKGGGVVDVFLASSQTKTNRTPSESSNFRDDVDLTGNDKVDGERIADEVDDLVTRVQDNILGAPRQSAGGTDLIGVSCVAADLLQGRTDKTLVLITDGMNASEPYRLRNINLDDASIATYVDEALASGLLCPLEGVQVYMYGVGMGSTTDRLEPGRLEAIEKFWRAALKAAGAELVAYQREP